MISVIIPVYNAEDSLKRCVDSVIVQTIFSDLEVILVDDGSTDASPAMIDAYVKQYPSIKGLHIRNQGVSNARNRGIELAKGEYLTFIDSDDYVEADYLEIMLNAFDEQVDIVASGFIAAYQGKKVSHVNDKRYILDEKQILHEFLLGSVVDPNVTDKVFRRKLIGDLRFDTHFRIAEDKYFLFQYLKKSRRMKVLDICKYYYVMTDRSAVRSDFSEKKLDSLVVAELVTREVQREYPKEYPLAKSMEMDVVCRVFCDMYKNGVPEAYRERFMELKHKIRSCDLKEKRKYSSEKHFLAFCAAWIHPGLYCFLKDTLKLQYQS